MFMAAMAVVMHYYENETDTVSGLVRGVLARFIES